MGSADNASEAEKKVTDETAPPPPTEGEPAVDPAAVPETTPPAPEEKKAEEVAAPAPEGSEPPKEA